MKKSGSARVVCVSSKAHYMFAKPKSSDEYPSTIKMEDLNFEHREYKSLLAYS